MYTQFIAVLGVTFMSLVAPTLAQDNVTETPNNGVCVSGSLMLLKCCSPSTFSTCETVDATCRPVPFNGACLPSINKLAIRFPAERKFYDELNNQGIFPTDLVNSTDSGDPIGSIDHHEAKLMKVRQEAREAIALEARGVPSSKTAGKNPVSTNKPIKPKGKSKYVADPGENMGLGMNGALPDYSTQPPQPCQIVGNVVLSSCDHENALLDHFMGDYPCDFGC